MDLADGRLWEYITLSYPSESKLGSDAETTNFLKGVEW